MYNPNLDGSFLSLSMNKQKQNHRVSSIKLSGGFQKGGSGKWVAKEGKPRRYSSLLSGGSRLHPHFCFPRITPYHHMRLFPGAN